MHDAPTRSRRDLPLAAALLVSLLAAGGATAQVQLEAHLSGFTGNGYATLLVEGNQISYAISTEWCCTQRPRARIVRRSDGAGMIDLAAVFRDPGTSGPSVWAWGAVTAPRARIDAIIANPGAYAVRLGQNPNLRSEGALAAIDKPVRPTSVVLPDVVREPGSPDFGMTTDVFITNQAAGALDITADYFAAGSATSSPTASTTVAVPSGAQVTLYDALDTLFSIDDGRGALALSADGEFAAGSRTPSSSMPGDPDQAAPQLSNAVPASFSGTLLGLTHSVANPTGFETSLFWVNPGPAAQIRLLAISGDGSVLGSVTRSLPAATNGSAPVFELIDTVPPAAREQDSFFVRYFAGQPLIVQAEVADRLSGERFRVDPVPAAPATRREGPFASTVGGVWHVEKRLIDSSQAEVCGRTVNGLAGWQEPELSIAAISHADFYDDVVWQIMNVGSRPGEPVLWDCDWDVCYVGRVDVDSLTAGYDIETFPDDWCSEPLEHSIHVSFEGKRESDRLITGTEVHQTTYSGVDQSPVEVVVTYSVVMRR